MKHGSGPSNDFSSTKGRLVLVNDSNGQIVGDLDLPLYESSDLKHPHDAKVGSSSPSKEPVVIEIDEKANGQSTVRVTPVSALRSSYGQSGSNIIGSAEFLSRGVLFAAEKLGSGVSSIVLLLLCMAHVRFGGRCLLMRQNTLRPTRRRLRRWFSRPLHKRAFKGCNPSRIRLSQCLARRSAKSATWPQALVLG